MDRLTPFTADDVYWSISGLTPDRARGKLRLRLAVVLRAQVEALSAALARCQLVPSFIEAEAGRIELSTARQHPADRLRRTMLPALCGLLALACLATPFVRQQMALDDAARAIAADAPSARTALALRQQLATAAQGRAAIARHGARATRCRCSPPSPAPCPTAPGSRT